MNTVQSVHACGENIDILEDFRYLGSVIQNSGGSGIVVCMQWRMFKRKTRLPGLKNPHLIFAVKALKIFATANYFFLGYIITDQETLMDAARVMSMILIPWAF